MVDAIDTTMAGRVSYVKRPICLTCWRRLAGEEIPPPSRFSFIQTRGKKKSAKKPTTINVKLLVDMKGYGRKGILHTIHWVRFYANAIPQESSLPLPLD